MITHRDIQNACYLGRKFNRYKSEKDIFWPFFVWRVAAPKNKQNLNVFQMLVLKLIMAGCHENEKLCLYSNLDNELVKYILAQLTSDGYLEGWRITETGKALLRGTEHISSEKTNYYLLQDATTGKLMPRVLTILPHIESIDFSGLYPQFVRSKGSGKIVKPFLISNTVKPEAPTAEQMSVCLRAYRRKLNELKQADLYVSDNELETTYSIVPIEDEPIITFMHTKLFSTITGERAWYLADPTGLTETLDELNESAELLLKSDKQFASRVNEVIGIADEGYVSSFQEQMLHFEEQAKVELFSKYPWVQKYKLIEKHLLGMLRLKMQVTYEQSPRFELLDSLLIELQRVLEAWLKILIQPKNENTEWEILVLDWEGDWPKKYQDNKKLRKQIFCRVNGVSNEVGFQLSTVPPVKIRSALTHGNESLKPLIAAVILKYPKIVELINSKYPSWLDLIIPLANDRNKYASHAGVENISKRSVLEHLSSVDELLKVLEKFIGSK